MKPHNGQQEPRYTDAPAVTFSLRFPALVCHRASDRCPDECPHDVTACGEFGPMRYVYLGDAMTDPALIGQPCDPVRRPDGRCIVSTRFATALVVFADGLARVVKRRRLRVVAPGP